MKVDFGQVLKDMDGDALKETIPNKFEENGEPALRDMTLGRLCSRALLQPGTDEKLQGDEHLRRFMLAERIHGDEVVDIEKAEDTVTIKTCLAQSFAPLAVGQAYRMLEGTNGAVDAPDTDNE